MKKQSECCPEYNVFDHGINIPNRRLYLSSALSGEDSGEVDSSMADMALKGIEVLSSKEYPENTPLTIIMNTCGGDFDNGLAIYDAIVNCEPEVHIHIYGRAWSMGSVLLQAADRRLMAPRARLMVHYGSYASGASDANPNTVDNEYNAAKNSVDVFEEIFLTRIREKKRGYKKSQMRREMLERYFDAREAIAFGLADDIIRHF